MTLVPWGAGKPVSFILFKLQGQSPGGLVGRLCVLGQPGRAQIRYSIQEEQPLEPRWGPVCPVEEPGEASGLTCH